MKNKFLHAFKDSFDYRLNPLKMMYILKKHGMRISINGCGCCGSPLVKFEYKGKMILGEKDKFVQEALVSMFAEEEELNEINIKRIITLDWQPPNNNDYNDEYDYRKAFALWKKETEQNI